MSTEDLDALRDAYRQASEGWVNAIQTKLALATRPYSEVEMEKWDAAGFALAEAEAAAKRAHDAFKDAVRKQNFGF